MLLFSIHNCTRQGRATNVCVSIVAVKQSEPAYVEFVSSWDTPGIPACQKHLFNLKQL